MTSKRQCWICYGEDGGVEFSSFSSPSSLSTTLSPSLSPSKISNASSIVVNGHLESSLAEEWVRPCRCRGSTAWVHQHCLLSWVERVTPASNQLTIPTVRCPQCQTPYQIIDKLVLPRWLLQLVDQLEVRRRDTLLWCAAGGAALGLYMLAITYGIGVTVVAGGGGDDLRKIIQIWEEAHSWKRHLNIDETLLVSRAVVGLPLVPLYVLSVRYRPLSILHPLIPMLVCPSWESLHWSWPPSPSLSITLLPLLNLAYRILFRGWLIPAIRRRLIPGLESQEYFMSNPSRSISRRDVNSSSRASSSSSLQHQNNLDANASLEGDNEEEELATFQASIIDITSTLIFPFLAAGLGTVIAPKFTSAVHRTLVGGGVLLAVGELLRTFTWYQKITSRRNRRVLSYK